jgi:hypothetical protein
VVPFTGSSWIIKVPSEIPFARRNLAPFVRRAPRDVTVSCGYEQARVDRGGLMNPQEMGLTSVVTPKR